MSDLTQLTQSPAELAPAAVAPLINPSTGVGIDTLVLSPQPGGKLIITPTQAAYADPMWPYYGHAIATYQTLDMENVFGTFPLSLVPPVIPGRSGDLATLLAEIFDVLITAADVIDVPLPTTLAGGVRFVLQASPNSVMWSGSRTITLHPTTVATTDLTDLVLNTVLTGITPPPAVPLDELITEPTVSGLTLSQLQG